MYISPATEADTGELSVMLGEIEGHYGGDPSPRDPVRIRRALFSGQPVATVLLAREGDGGGDGAGAVLGLASYSLLWPASGPDTSLFLKELYVREGARRGGVARALMGELRKVAAEAGCIRVEWTADTDNPSALAFYASLGAEHKADKIFYRTTI
jgi:GNAT superfamily N-acetyltransferase